MTPQRIREILTSESNRLRAGDEVDRHAGYALLDFIEFASEADLLRMRELLSVREPAPIPMTPLQQNLWAQIARYEGKGEIMIAISRHAWEFSDDKIYPQKWKPVAYASAGTLRGMEMKGKIRIVTSYWRGMTIEVL